MSSKSLISTLAFILIYAEAGCGDNIHPEDGGIPRCPACGPDTVIPADAAGSGADGAAADAAVADAAVVDSGSASPCTSDNDCDDNVFCNGVETCELATNTCLPGTPPLITDGLQCTADSCNEDADAVEHVPNDTLCDGNDICSSYACDAVAGCQQIVNPVCPACSHSLHDNGAYTGIDAVRALSWLQDGITDDFVNLGPATNFCTIGFNFAHGGLPVSQFQVVLIRIYSLGATGIPGLGNFGSAVPVFEQTYRIAAGTLIATDTGDDIGSYDVISYRAMGTTFDLGVGAFAIHISFPDWIGGLTGDGFWMTAPQSGSSECSHLWGSSATMPLDLCTAGMPEAQNLDVRLIGPEPALP